MEDKANVIWNEIEKKNYDYYMSDCIEKTLRDLRKKDVIDFYKSWMLKRIAKLSLQLYNPALK